MMRLQGFMGIRLLAKQIQSSFDKCLHYHEMPVRIQIPRVLCLRYAVVNFCLPRKIVGRGVMIHIPCGSIRFRLLPFDFGYFDSIM